MDNILAGYGAHRAGLKEGGLIVSVNGQTLTEEIGIGNTLLADLHAELRRKWQESAATIRSIPKEKEAHKNYLWWITFENALSGYAPEIFRRQFERMQDLLAS